MTTGASSTLELPQTSEKVSATFASGDTLRLYVSDLSGASLDELAQTAARLSKVDKDQMHLASLVAAALRNVQGTEGVTSTKDCLTTEDGRKAWLKTVRRSLFDFFAVEYRCVEECVDPSLCGHRLPYDRHQSEHKKATKISKECLETLVKALESETEKESANS